MDNKRNVNPLGFNTDKFSKKPSIIDWFLLKQKETITIVSMIGFSFVFINAALATIFLIMGFKITSLIILINIGIFLLIYIISVDFLYKKIDNILYKYKSLNKSKLIFGSYYSYWYLLANRNNVKFSDDVLYDYEKFGEELKIPADVYIDNPDIKPIIEKEIKENYGSDAEVTNIKKTPNYIKTYKGKIMVDKYAFHVSGRKKIKLNEKKLFEKLLEDNSNVVKRESNRTHWKNTLYTNSILPFRMFLKYRRNKNKIAENESLNEYIKEFQDYQENYLNNNKMKI